MIKEITIGPKKIKIKVVKRIPGEDRHTLGVWEPGDRIIYIRKQNKQEMVYTLLHEIFHSILWTKSMHNLFKPKMEEIICDLFADSLVELIDNKQLVKLIKGAKNGKNK